jgi:glutamate synthase (ferredoxin)
MIAEEVRELMAQLGFRTVNEMVGRRDKLDPRKAVEHWKARKLDLTPVLYMPEVPKDVMTRRVHEQDHGLSKALDNLLIELAKDALEYRTPVELQLPIRNGNRTVGTMLGAEITRRYGADGLPDETVRIRFTGSAGQSFGAFVPKGLSMTLEGDANDYFGKGLSGGRLVIFPPAAATYRAEENIIIGNVALYGATSGEALIRGVAGERFAVRNSGAITVVEGVGDHGCEYMTGGRVVVLGRTGRNFAAGMSGGIAYVINDEGDFPQRCNLQMVDLEKLEDAEEERFVRSLIQRHAELTKSIRAETILLDWEKYREKLIKVMPLDYRRVLAEKRQTALKAFAMVQHG